MSVGSQFSFVEQGLNGLAVLPLGLGVAGVSENIGDGDVLVELVLLVSIGFSLTEGGS